MKEDNRVMKEYKRTQEIFDLLAKIRDGNKEALQEAKRLADKFFLLNREYNLCLLVFEYHEIVGVQKCFTFKGGISFSFFIPESFSLKEVTFDGEIYLFFAEDDRVITATSKQLEGTWEELPFAGIPKELRVTVKHIERAFLNIEKNNCSDYQDEYFGLIEWTSQSYYSIHEYEKEGYNFSIIVKTQGLERLKKSLLLLRKAINTIELLDKMARKELKKEFTPTDEELDAVSLGLIEFYEDGEFDLYYNLPEEEALEYVKVCFSKESNLLLATAGNY